MTIQVKIVADSVNESLPPWLRRITTFQLKYPRFIHPEIMTYRIWSRNASSSRAVPVERMIADILEDTAMPVHWGKNQKGMQAREELSALEIEKAKSTWFRARDKAIIEAQELIKIGAHKQIVNRILEPFAHISVVLTATNFDNCFHQRRHADAQPEFKVLADSMFDALASSTPKILKHGMWHFPYVTDEERSRVGDDGLLIYSNDKLTKMSVARCARVSYLTHDGATPSYAADAALYDRLVGSSPLHASPAEHQAQALIYDVCDPTYTRRAHLGGNLGPGWLQYRKTLPNENYIKEAA